MGSGEAARVRKTMQHRAISRLIGILVGAIGLSCIPAAQAQFSANFQTNVISGVTSNWGGNGSYIVGSNTFLDALQILSGGVLSNSTGYIGYEIAGSNNAVYVTGSSAAWSNVNNVYVGYSGARNQLIITNGGQVACSSGNVGLNASSSNNIVLVSGSGSIWSNRSSLTVGSSGSGNQLIITNGGVVFGFGSIGNQSAGNSNSVIVNGTNSVWNGLQTMGGGGAGNRLTIVNGGRVISTSAFVGDSTFSSNNIVLISGGGSVWSINGGGMRMGHSGAGNQLIITNGGAVYNDYTMGLGYDTSASNNLVIVTGTGSIVSNDFDFQIGPALGASNQLRIVDGGTLWVRFQSSISGSRNVAIVTGLGSIWTNGTDVIVGNSGNGRGDQLIITNNGAVYDRNGIIDSVSASTNNSVTIIGIGSTWNNSSNLFVGASGSGSRLTITNGGAAFNSSGYVGAGFFADFPTQSTSSSNNEAVVTGNGSIWSNRFDFYLGYYGSDNRLTITNAGKVYNGSGYIGRGGRDGFSVTRYSSNNVALVSKSGATWSNLGDLFVGYDYGGNNQLLITDTGSVLATNVFVGYTTNSTGNKIAVDGGNLTITNGTAVLGYYGSGELIVSNGSVMLRDVTAGYNGGARGTLTVAGGTTVISSNLVLGITACTATGTAIVAGGSLYVTNAAHTAVLDVRCGQLNVSSGLLQVDILICTNACGHISHTGGTLIVGSLVLDPNLDADNDGLPNGWEQTYGIDPLSGGGANGPAGDADGDGMSNLQEFLAGTDPTNSASSFRITSVVGSGSDVLISWMTGIGKTNALQVTAGGGYATNGFADIFTVTNAVSATTNYLDVGASTNSPARYYRVRLVP